MIPIIGILSLLAVVLGAWLGGELAAKRTARRLLREARQDATNAKHLTASAEAERESEAETAKRFRGLAESRAACIANLRERITALEAKLPKTPPRGEGGRFVKVAK